MRTKKKRFSFLRADFPYFEILAAALISVESLKSGALRFVRHSVAPPAEEEAPTRLQSWPKAANSGLTVVFEGRVGGSETDLRLAARASVWLSFFFSFFK